MHGRRDFATGLPIPEEDDVQFDHIHAYAEGGETDLNNIAPMSAETNRAKSTLTLEDYRVKLRLNEFFKSGDRLTLGHLLKFLKGNGAIKAYGQVIETVGDDGEIEVRSAVGNTKHQLYTCPATGWKYFYAKVPVDLIESMMNPIRALDSSLATSFPRRYSSCTGTFSDTRSSSRRSGESLTTG
jgi:hypothetical protein